VVEAGGRSRLVGGSLPVGRPVEVVGGGIHPGHHSIGRCPRGEGPLFRAECYGAENYIEGENTLRWIVLVLSTFGLVVVVVARHGEKRGGRKSPRDRLVAISEGIYKS